jgi:hypothetical protein
MELMILIYFITIINAFISWVNRQFPLLSQTYSAISAGTFTTTTLPLKNALLIGFIYKSSIKPT